jgi:hypothetical protein
MIVGPIEAAAIDIVVKATLGFSWQALKARQVAFSEDGFV